MLRNIATRGCPADTDVILLLDVDFQLCCGVAVATSVERHAARVRKENISIVLPAFEPTQRGISRAIGRPHSKNQLRVWAPRHAPHTVQCAASAPARRSV
eukprot:4630783-Prymnesium_polylepis.1